MKKIICPILSFFMVFTLFACNSITTDKSLDDLQKQIVDLESRIEQQGEEISELKEKIGGSFGKEVEIGFNLAFGTMNFGGYYYDNEIWQELINKVNSGNFSVEEVTELYEKIRIADLPIKALANSYSKWLSINSTLAKLNAKKSESALSKLKDKYNEQFFIDNALIVCISMIGSSGSVLNKVQLVKYDNELVVKVFATQGILTVSSDWAVFLEVKKDDLKNVSDILIVENFK